MDVFRRLPPADQRHPCALTIGNFDGVHLGHQAVLAELRAQADRRGLPTCVLTFEPHPRDSFANDTGWRIDYHLATPALARSAVAARTDREPSRDARLSDHAPVVVDYALP